MRKNLSHMSEEAYVIRKLSLVGIIGNIILSSFKLAAGICGHSGAMVSDAIHSASDVFTTVVACFGVRLAKKNADKEHPYGHERMECMAALILGMVLMLTGLGIGTEGLKHIMMATSGSAVIPGPIALWAAVISIFSKEAMFWYTRYYARLLNSAAFLADAWHHRSDALSSVGSLLGIGGAMLGFPVLDAVASVVIFQAQDVLKLDNWARMNTPGTVGSNWRWRMRPGELNQGHADHLAWLVDTFGRF